MKYYCFICDTPYHLLNCINLYISIKKPDDRADIFIGDSFRTYNKIADNLEQVNIFDRIIKYKTPHLNNKLKLLRNKFIEFASEKKILLLWTNGKIDLTASYSDIFFAYNSPFVCTMRQMYHTAKMHLFEDGTSTYLGYAQVLSRKRKFVYRCLKKDIRIYDDYDLWVNNVNLYKNIHPKERHVIKAIPPLAPDKSNLMSILEFVLNNQSNNNFSECKYKDFNYIFLTQPYDFLTQCNKNNIQVFREAEENVLKVLQKEYKSVIRVHPRQKDSNYKNFYVDYGNNMWEIICATDISNHHVLVSFCSTAQIIPKLFYNIEPYLIFMFPMVECGLSKKRIKSLRNFIHVVMKLYNNKDKIIVLEKPEDFQKTIDKIKLIEHCNE